MSPKTPCPPPKPVPLKDTTSQRLGPPWCDVDELDDYILLTPAPNVKHSPHPTRATVTIVNPTPDMIQQAVGIMMDAVNIVGTHRKITILVTTTIPRWCRPCRDYSKPCTTTKTKHVIFPVTRPQIGFFTKTPSVAVRAICAQGALSLSMALLSSSCP
jgi:hypothetical protein